jgi:RNA polymerase sigma factor (sigma-70 family)
MNYIEQENEAKRLIIKYGKPWMLNDNEAIGEIISTCMNVRLKYNAELNRFSTYLIRSVKNKMTNLSKNRYRAYKKLSQLESYDNHFYTDSMSNEGFYEIIQSRRLLTQLERECLIRYYIQNERIKDIASDKNCTRQHIDQQIKNAILKLRKVSNVCMD